MRLFCIYEQAVRRKPNDKKKHEKKNKGKLNEAAVEERNHRVSRDRWMGFVSTTLTT